jgi:hypothetical protein
MHEFFFLFFNTPFKDERLWKYIRVLILGSQRSGHRGPAHDPAAVVDVSHQRGRRTDLTNLRFGRKVFGLIFKVKLWTKFHQKI